MVREGRFPYGSTAVSQSSDAAKIFQTYLAGADREYIVLLLLDGKHRVNALNVVAVGSLTSALVHPREVFKPAILANAAAVIVGHNHPSGDTEPSREDRELTDRLVQAGRLLGITVLDHVIVGEERFFSFADHHLIPNGGPQ
jgi:DNA repair protein RadC